MVAIDLDKEVIEIISSGPNTSTLIIPFKSIKILAYPDSHHFAGGPSIEEVIRFYDTALAGFSSPSTTVKIVAIDGETVVGRLRRGTLGRFPLLLDMDKKSRNQLMLVTQARSVSPLPESLREVFADEWKIFLIEKIGYILILALLALTVGVISLIDLLGAGLELDLAKRLIRICSTATLVVLFLSVVLSIVEIFERRVYRKAVNMIKRWFRK